MMYAGLATCRGIERGALSLCCSSPLFKNDKRDMEEERLIFTAQTYWSQETADTAESMSRGTLVTIQIRLPNMPYHFAHSKNQSQEKVIAILHDSIS